MQFAEKLLTLLLLSSLTDDSFHFDAVCKIIAVVAVAVVVVVAAAAASAVDEQ